MGVFVPADCYVMLSKMHFSHSLQRMSYCYGDLGPGELASGSILQWRAEARIGVKFVEGYTLSQLIMS